VKNRKDEIIIFYSIRFRKIFLHLFDCQS